MKLNVFVYATLLFLLLAEMITHSAFIYILFILVFNQIVFELSKHFFHHYFDIHAELEIMFIGMVYASYQFGLLPGLILAVLGTLVFKGQIPLECNFNCFFHDIPYRIIIALLVFFLKGHMPLAFLGVFVSVLYYIILHSSHELIHGHIPVFELPTIIANWITSMIVIGYFLPMLI